jgi:hypothetical protein
MQDTATVRLARSTHESLKSLATHDGVTLDEEMQRLIRAERQRRMGDALASLELDDADHAVLRSSARDATRR